MPFEIAYGMSVTTKDGVYYIGGSTDAVGAKTITRLTTDVKGKLKIEKVGELPFKIQNGVAGYAMEHFILVLAIKVVKQVQIFINLI